MAIDLFFWFIRILQVTSIISTLGPKIIMIERMLRDLMFFILIILIFLISFGIITQVNQNFLFFQYKYTYIYILSF